MAATEDSLEVLEMHGDFIRRHIGSDIEQIREICEYLELENLESIIKKVIPETIISSEGPSISKTISEDGVHTYLNKIGKSNLNG